MIHRAVVVVAITTVTVAGCTGGTRIARSHSGAADQLTMIISSAPANLDPGLLNADPNNLAVDQLAYEPLIRKGPDGSYDPALATSFGYQGSGNRSFFLQLRSGAKFADGTPVDAAAVANSLRYEAKAGGPGAGWLGSCTNFAAPEPMRVQVTCGSPNPILPLLFSQNSPFGLVISPAGLASPKALQTSTAGAGPYVLDTARSVTNNQYVFDANKNYWNPSAVHFGRVTIKVISNPNSTLNAIRSGQADVAIGDPSTADAAKAAGLDIVAAPSYTVGVGLYDRGGADSKPLADARVRQALNYAIDRAAITKALFGSYGTPTTQLQTPAYDGYSEALNSMYGYDPGKARQLLAAAGYPNGFPLQLEAWQGYGIANVTQAIVGYWSKVGIRAQITSDAAPAAWVTHVLSKKFPAAGYGFAGLPVFLSGTNWFRPLANPFNPFSVQDPRLTDLLDRAAAAGPAQSDALSLQAMTYALQQSWWVTSSLVDVVYYARKGVTGVSVTPKSIYADMSKIAMT